MADLQIKVTRTLPSPPPQGGGGGEEGTATRRVRLSTEQCQRYDQVTGHKWLIDSTFQ